MSKAPPALAQRFADTMGQMLGPDFPSKLGIAVSGGGDSMALLYLTHNWARVMGIPLHVATIDHGLRAESASEAAFVAEECGALGHGHDVLRWDGWDGTGNLQDAARRARLDLIDGWRGDVAHVLFGHTADDQAETLLMRLRRGSGVDGLAGIPPRRTYGERSRGYTILRPLLAERREALRHYLRVFQGTWVEDPSNHDPLFDRVRMRKLLTELEPQGMGVPHLADTARQMARARAALIARARSVLDDVAQTTSTGDVLLHRDPLAALEEESRLRLMAASLIWVASAEYRPRLAALEALTETVLSGGAATLHGCEVRAEGAVLRITREFNAVCNVVVPVGAPWDTRWQADGDAIAGLSLRALGEDGLSQIGTRPAGAPPWAALRSVPAIFDGDVLVACAALGHGPEYNTQLCPPHGTLSASLDTH